MHVSEELDLQACVDCLTEVRPGTDRAFMLAEDEVLCAECAVRRGGIYDENEDRWLVPPAREDLIDRVESREHAPRDRRRI